MKQNEGRLDRRLRAVLAIIFLLLAFYLPSGTWRVVFIVLALIAAVTAASGFCLLYKIFGISTKKSR